MPRNRLYVSLGQLKENANEHFVLSNILAILKWNVLFNVMLMTFGTSVFTTWALERGGTALCENSALLVAYVLLFPSLLSLRHRETSYLSWEELHLMQNLNLTTVVAVLRNANPCIHETIKNLDLLWVFLDGGTLEVVECICCSTFSNQSLFLFDLWLLGE